MSNLAAPKTGVWQNFKSSNAGKSDDLKRSVATIRTQVRNDLKVLQSAGFVTQGSKKGNAK